MDTQDFQKLIDTGENETIEFKRSTAQTDRALRTICGFLNHKGGVIYFGISDKNVLVGQQVSDSTLKSISQKIRQKIKPETSPNLKVLEINKKKIIEVKVKEGANKPYYLDSIAYKRVGSETPPIAPEELEHIILKKKRYQWDTAICEGATLADIDEEKVRKFKKIYEYTNKIWLKSSDKDILKSLICLKFIDGTFFPTNAGILLFGKDPQHFLPQSTIKIAIYPETIVGTKHIDITEFNGDIFSQVDEAEKYILRSVYTSSILKIGQIERTEIPQYPYFALRELIVNAVVHRDFSITGSNIIIKIFSNRIEYQSPGSLPAGITSKNIIREQFLRNRAIGKAFSKIKYIEEMGEGWDRIMEEIITHPLKPQKPKIEDTKASVIVTLFSAKHLDLVKLDETMVNERLTKVNERLTKKLSDNEKSILIFTIKNNQITSADCQRLLNVSRVMTNKYFKMLIQKQVLVKKGSGRSTYYVMP